MSAVQRFIVRPRYTAGSPGSVDEATALRVVADERRAYEAARAGRSGDDEQRRAVSHGLGPRAVDGVQRSIVELTEEHGRSGIHAGHWCVHDLLTGELYARPFVPGADTGYCKRCKTFADSVIRKRLQDSAAARVAEVAAARSDAVVEVVQAGPMTAIEIHVGGELWCTIATVRTTMPRRNGRGGWSGPDWAATRQRADRIAAGLRRVLADGGE